MTLLSGQPADPHEPFDQRILRRRDLRLVERACLPRGLEVQQALSDRGLVVQLVLRLLLDALRQPDRPADGSEPERQQAGDQAHAAVPGLRSISAKLYGGSGPT